MDLASFLKQYSTIPNSFIDDFHQIFNSNEHTDFLIDLDLTSKWLGTRKDHLKRTLLGHYREHVDFNIGNDEILSNNKMGRPVEKIFVTIDTFKRMCMRSKTENGELVRTYYLQLEEFIDKYKDYIIKGLNDRIHQLENNQKPQINVQSGVIYVFRVQSDNRKDRYKIGKTTNLKTRMIQHNSSHADNVEIVFIYEVNDIDRVESCLKSIVKPYQYRRSKEIYEIQLDTLKEVINSCGKLITKVEQLQSSIPLQQQGGTQTVYAMCLNSSL